LSIDRVLLDQVLHQHDVSVLFQPIVDLRSGNQVVAYEALTRGPAGTPLERPDVLVSAARDAGRVKELDALLRSRALQTASSAGLGAPYSLFVNVEPDALTDMSSTVGEPHPPAVLELTERALTEAPGRLLRSIRELREQGWLIAIDDLGVNPHSLALLPLLAPDVIKLDMSLVQNRPDQRTAMIAAAVTAYAEASDVIVLAEGIETPKHLAAARALNADLGQGWLFGRPAGAEHIDVGTAGLQLRREPVHRAPDLTPFGIASATRPAPVAGRDLLLEISHFLEAHALRAGDSAVLLSTFQTADYVTPHTWRRYDDLAAAGVITALMARDMPDPAERPSLHLVELTDDEPLADEWDVAVITPDFAGLLTAREVTTTDVREFEYVLTHDRTLVLEAGHALLDRLGR
jgi:EAL domain-containing protein (putative c-di-GMP-specific phosphodiesterase class I)